MSDAADKKPDVLVRAIKPGSFNGRRRLGDLFHVTADVTGTWFKPLTDQEIATLAAKAEHDAAPARKRGDANIRPDFVPGRTETKTLSEHAKATGQSSPNTASNGREKITLATAGKQAGADLV